MIAKSLRGILPFLYCKAKEISPPTDLVLYIKKPILAHVRLVGHCKRKTCQLISQLLGQAPTESALLRDAVAIATGICLADSFAARGSKSVTIEIAGTESAGGALLARRRRTMGGAEMPGTRQRRCGVLVARLMTETGEAGT